MVLKICVEYVLNKFACFMFMQCPIMSDSINNVQPHIDGHWTNLFVYTSYRHICNAKLFKIIKLLNLNCNNKITVSV